MLKRAIRKALRTRGKDLASISELEFYRSIDSSSMLYSQLAQGQRELIAPFLPYSKSQIAQDLFALAFSETSSPKFFVEFGATDGVTLSNTWLLENKLGWSGILAEPARHWHELLAQNRSCHIDKRCVAKTSGLKYQFLEVASGGTTSPELSSIEKYATNGDWASDLRLNNSSRYEVDTVSLDDLLDECDAPSDIQFLSLDTEGSELEILEGYTFGKRHIRSICVEHNYVDVNRRQINALLLENGYKQVLRHVSRFDDWYVLAC
jgi:FkbM family methyltransferase